MIDDRLKCAAEKVAREVPTPFHVVDPGGVERDFVAMDKAWREFFPRFSLAYSYKSNPLVAFTRLLRSLGALAEVVSGPELQAALDDGFAPRDILFDGPVKSPAESAFAVARGVGLQIDSSAEAEHLAAATRDSGGAPRVCLRLAMPTDSGRWSRFGLLPDEAPYAWRLLADAGVVVRGVHLGVGTLVRDPETYRAAIRLWRRTIRAWAAASDEPFVLNLGGGFPPRREAADPIAPWRDFAAGAAEECRSIGLPPEDVRLVIEPGRSLVEEHGVLVARVAVRKRRAEGADLLVLDAGTNLARTVKSRPHPIEFVRADPPSPTGAPPGTDAFDLYGNNCYEEDVFARGMRGPASLAPGDLVLVGCVGAYDMPFSHVWVRPRPPVFAVSDSDDHVVVRERGTRIR
ncbi:hypothetical protein OG948_48735 (plasmid) [Embleya sp. NBC_00888]|uniref:hypothetical protein n=1 Tax=Embleya sp. NBC_00888 TaxID=2975960 RepID=UPI002F9080C1|nr:hypothetical protein OG948_48735 [Embleya sp. NBC_00888]